MSLIEPVAPPPSPRRRWLFPAAQAALFVLLSALLRATLLVKFGSKLTLGAEEYFRMFAVGLLLDAAVAAVAFFPLMAWLAVALRSWLGRKWHQALLLGATWTCWVLLIFLFQAEYFFFEEYTSRFNTVAIDYLHYWTEVRENIGAMYPVKTVIALSGGMCARLATLFGWLAAGIALVLGASRVDFQASSERLVNEIASNGLTNGLIALWTRDLEYTHFFPTLPREEAFVRARKLLDSRS